MIARVSNYFVKTDNVCDYIPVVSTLTNTVVLFEKYVVLNFIKPELINDNRYYSHLKQKNILRCVALLVPFIGNITIAIYDFINKKSQNRDSAFDKYNDRDFMLAATCQKVWAFEQASNELKSDKHFMLDVVQKNGWALEGASEELKNDRDVVLVAVRQNAGAFQYASSRLKADGQFMLQLIQECGSGVLRHASKKLTGDKSFMLAAVKLNGLAIRYADKALKKDHELRSAAISQNAAATEYV